MQSMPGGLNYQANLNPLTGSSMAGLFIK